MAADADADAVALATVVMVDAANTVALANPTFAAAAVNAVFRDLLTFQALNLGPSGELGEPIRWNDPRLGPLWPDGPPPWHVQAEEWVRKLEDQLAVLPPPGFQPAPLGDDLAARLADRAWLDEQYDAGELDRYLGRYVIAANRTILGDGDDLIKLRKKVRKQAQADGIPAGRLVEYFVPTA